MAVTVSIWPIGDLKPITNTVEAVSFVNSGSYGPGRNFDIFDEEDNPDGHEEVLVINVEQIIAAKVTVTEE